MCLVDVMLGHAPQHSEGRYLDRKAWKCLEQIATFLKL
jgi:hypothetical protein